MAVHHQQTHPSPWITRYLKRAQPGATALDVATGSGRHARLALAQGYTVTALDRDLSRIGLHAAPNLVLIQSDREDGSPWPLAAQTFDVVIVTNYLHRPILPAVVAAVASDGLLLYETFAVGNERYGRPSNPNFLLRPGELLGAVHGCLTPVAYEHATLSKPDGSPAAIVQRIAAVGPTHLWLASPPPASGETP